MISQYGLEKEINFHQSLMEIKAKMFSIIAVMVFLIGFGTIVYNHLEKWSWVDSIYFTTTTLTTIGFGDLHPTNDASKMFTVFFVVIGVSFILFSLTLIADTYFQYAHHRVERKIEYVSSKFNEKRRPWRR